MSAKCLPIDCITIPGEVAHREEWLTMTGSEFRVMFLLIHACSGSNNGFLSATKTDMKRMGGMDDKTLAKALQGLGERKLITKTGKEAHSSTGALSSLYALAWLPIDDQ